MIGVGVYFIVLQVETSSNSLWDLCRLLLTESGNKCTPEMYVCVFESPHPSPPLCLWMTQTDRQRI